MPLNLFPPEEETIVGTAEAIRRREQTSRAVVEGCLEQIERWEPEIRAWVHLDRDAALQHAEQLDRELSDGRYRGPLHGIPVGIKDIIDVAGWPTAAGSPLRGQEVAEDDAPVVSRLRQAGAVILGKTVTTQFACFDPPPTRNPWDRRRTPGGSSSGSAAAVATGMCLAALGSQTGGSITRPAAYCGLCGCKPAFGRVNRQGVVPVAEHLDHVGPLARCLADLAVMLEATADFSFASQSDHENSFFQGVSRPGDSEAEKELPPRLGRLGGFFDNRAEETVRETFASSVSLFSQAGAEVSETPLPCGFDDLHRQHRLIMAVELAATHERRLQEHGDDYEPGVTGLIEEGLATPVTHYVRALRHQRELTETIRDAFADRDVLLCPAAVGPAPDPSTTGDPLFNSPWSYTGLPTVNVPMGLSDDGLPLGLQLVGRPFDEPRLFQTARWCEAVLRRNQ